MERDSAQSRSVKTSYLSIGHSSSIVELWVWDKNKGLKTSGPIQILSGDSKIHEEIFPGVWQIRGRVDLDSNEGSFVVLNLYSVGGHFRSANLDEIFECISVVESEYPGVVFYVWYESQGIYGGTFEDVYRLSKNESRNHLSESVVDFTQGVLSPEIFSIEHDEYVILDQVRAFLLEQAEQFKQFGHVEGVFIGGSILSFQWTTETDIDVKIIIRPDSPQDLEAAVTLAINKKWQHIKIPGTNHELDFFVLTWEEFNIENFDGLYDVDYPKWIKGPYSLSANVDDYMQSFRQFVKEIDLERMQFKQDLFDYQKLQGMSAAELKSLHSQVEKKIEEISNDARNLSSSYEVAHILRDLGFKQHLTPGEAKQYKSKNLLPTNVIYKLLEKYHYIEFLRKVREVLKKAGGIIDSPEDVEKLMQIEQPEGFVEKKFPGIRWLTYGWEIEEGTFKDFLDAFKVEEENFDKKLDRLISEITNTGSCAGYALPLGMRRKKKKRKVK